MVGINTLTLGNANKSFKEKKKESKKKRVNKDQMTGLSHSKFSLTRWTIMTLVKTLTTTSHFKRLFSRKV